jgi:hypothetical protein
MLLEERKRQITAAIEELKSNGVTDLEQRLLSLKALLEAADEDDKHKGSTYKFYQEETDRLEWYWPSKLRTELYTADDLEQMGRLRLRRMAQACGVSMQKVCSMSYDDIMAEVLKHKMTYDVPPPHPKWAFDTEDTEELVDRFVDIPDWNCEAGEPCVNFDEIREEGIGIVVRLEHIANKFGLDASVYLYRALPDIPDYENPKQVVEAWWGGDRA